MELGVLLRTLLQLYAMLLLGFGLCKLGTLDGHVNRSLSALVVSVTYPAKLLRSSCCSAAWASICACWP